jgi:hypothetical protein
MTTKTVIGKIDGDSNIRLELYANSTNPSGLIVSEPINNNLYITKGNNLNNPDVIINDTQIYTNKNIYTRSLTQITYKNIFFPLTSICTISKDSGNHVSDGYLLMTTLTTTFTINLPFEPLQNTRIVIFDYDGNANVRNITVVPSGSDIIVNDIININHISREFIYVNTIWTGVDIVGNILLLSENDNVLLCNTSVNSYELYLPVTPSPGTYLTIKDTGNANINNVIIHGNGTTIEGLTDITLTILFGTFELGYFNEFWFKKIIPLITENLTGDIKKIFSPIISPYNITKDGFNNVSIGYVLVQTVSYIQTIILPEEPNKNTRIIIKDIDNNANINNITVIPSGADTIDGLVTDIISANTVSREYIYITPNWVTTNISGDKILLLKSDYVLLCDTASISYTLYLPTTTSAFSGLCMVFKDLGNAQNNNIIINGNGALIDDQLLILNDIDYGTISLIYDGILDKWFNKNIPAGPKNLVQLNAITNISPQTGDIWYDFTHNVFMFRENGLTNQLFVNAKYKKITVPISVSYIVTKDTDNYVEIGYIIIQTLVQLFTIILPESPLLNTRIIIKDIDTNSSVNNITINPSGADTIDFIASNIINTNDISREFIYSVDNANWSTTDIIGNTILINSSDHFVLCDTSIRGYTLYLSQPSTNGKLISFKDLGNGETNNIIVNGNGINIDGSTTIRNNANYGVIRLFYDGTVWYNYNNLNESESNIITNVLKLNEITNTATENASMWYDDINESFYFNENGLIKQLFTNPNYKRIFTLQTSPYIITKNTDDYVEIVYILVQTTIQPFIITLPDTPIQNTRIVIKDIDANSNINNIIINPSGIDTVNFTTSNIININNISREFVYIGGTSNWITADLFNNLILIDRNDSIVLCDTSIIGFTLSLPLSTFSGTIVTFKDLGNANTNNITIDSNGSTIDGNVNLVNNADYGISKLFYDGTEWFNLNVLDKVQPIAIVPVNSIKFNKIINVTPITPSIWYDSAEEAFFFQENEITKQIFKNPIYKKIIVPTSTPFTITKDLNNYVDNGYIIVQTTILTLDIILPDTPIQNTRIVIKDINGNASINIITITPSGSNTINGTTLYNITSNNASYELIFIGVNWVPTPIGSNQLLLTNTDNVVLCDTSVIGYTLHLQLTPSFGDTILIKDLGNASINNIIINGNSISIDNTLFITNNVNYGIYNLFYDGTQWYKQNVAAEATPLGPASTDLISFNKTTQVNSLTGSQWYDLTNELFFFQENYILKQLNRNPIYKKVLIPIISPFIITKNTSNYVDSGYIIVQTNVLTFTITLPDTPIQNTRIVVFDIDGNSNVNNITINPSGGDTLNTLTTFVISTNFNSVELLYFGTNWTTSVIIGDKLLLHYTDNIILCDTSIIGYNLFLQTTPTIGDVIEIKDLGNANTNNIIANGNGFNIDGSTTSINNVDFGNIQLYFDGTEWHDTNVTHIATIPLGSSDFILFNKINNLTPVTASMWYDDTSETFNFRENGLDKQLFRNPIYKKIFTPSTSLYVITKNSYDYVDIGYITVNTFLFILTITLPDTPLQNTRILIQDLDGNANFNNITINASGADTINTTTNYIISTNNVTYEILYIGTNWIPTLITGNKLLLHYADNVILCDTSITGYTIYLQNTPSFGDTIIIKDLGNSNTNNIIIHGNGVNIDNNISIINNADFGNVSLFYNGTQWYNSGVASEAVPIAPGSTDLILLNKTIQASPLTGTFWYDVTDEMFYFHENGITRQLARNPIYKKIIVPSGSPLVITKNLLNYVDIGYIVVQTTSLTLTITLPDAPIQNTRIVIKDINGNSNTNNISINPSGTDTINATTTYVINTNFASYELLYTNTNWTPTVISGSKLLLHNTDNVILCDTTIIGHTLHLQDTPTIGDTIIVKDLGNANNNNIIINGNGNTIDDSVSVLNDANYGIIRLFYNDTQWYNNNLLNVFIPDPGTGPFDTILLSKTTNLNPVDGSIWFDITRNQFFFRDTDHTKTLFANSVYKLFISPFTPSYTITKDSSNFVEIGYIVLLTLIFTYTITLPNTPLQNTRIVIFDYSSNANTNNINVNPSGADTVNSGATDVINTNSTCRQYIYDKTSTNWVSLDIAGDKLLLLESDNTILCNTVNLGYTIYLPILPIPLNGTIITIKDSGNALTNNIIINGNGVNIDDNATIVINNNYGVKILMYNGNQWYDKQLLTGLNNLIQLTSLSNYGNIGQYNFIIKNNNLFLSYNGIYVLELTNTGLINILGSITILFGVIADTTDPIYNTNVIGNFSLISKGSTLFFLYNTTIIMKIFNNGNIIISGNLTVSASFTHTTTTIIDSQTLQNILPYTIQSIDDDLIISYNGTILWILYNNGDLEVLNNFVIVSNFGIIDDIYTINNIDGSLKINNSGRDIFSVNSDGTISGNLTNITMSSLTDSTITPPNLYDILFYDTVSNKWINQPPSALFNENNIPSLTIGSLKISSYKYVIVPTLTYTITKDINGYVSNKYIAVTSTVGTYTITLPEEPLQNTVVIIKDIDGNAFVNNITINRSGSDTINFTISNIINTNLKSRSFTYISTNWQLLDVLNDKILLDENDSIILCNTSLFGFTLYLPFAPTNGTSFIIKDLGNALNNNIIINGNGNNIDNFSTITNNENYSSMNLLFNDNQWYNLQINNEHSDILKLNSITHPTPINGNIWYDDTYNMFMLLEDGYRHTLSANPLYKTIIIPSATLQTVTKNINNYVEVGYILARTLTLASLQIILPDSPLTNTRIVVTDIDNNSNSSNITVDPSGTNTINNTTTDIINVNSTSRIYLYSNNNWAISDIPGNKILLFEKDNIILCNTTLIGYTLYLPQTPIQGTQLSIKDLGNSKNNNIIIDANGSVVDSNISIVINYNYGIKNIIYNDTNWHDKTINGGNSDFIQLNKIMNTNKTTGSIWYDSTNELFSFHENNITKELSRNPIYKKISIPLIPSAVITKDINNYVNVGYILVETTIITLIVIFPDTPLQNTRIVIKDVDGNSSANNITINPSGSNTINNVTTFVINTNNASYQFIYTGINWTPSLISGDTILLHNNDNVILCDSSKIAYTLTLPQNLNVGTEIIIKDLGNASSNNIIISSGGPILIDNVTSVIIDTNYGILNILQEDLQWYIKNIIVGGINTGTAYLKPLLIITAGGSSNEFLTTFNTIISKSNNGDVYLPNSTTIINGLSWSTQIVYLNGSTGTVFCQGTDVLFSTSLGIGVAMTNESPKIFTFVGNNTWIYQ